MASFLSNFTGLVEYLTSREKCIQLEHGGVTFRVELENERHTFMLVEWLADRQRLRFSTPLPVRCIESERQRLAIAVTMLSSKLALSGFQQFGDYVLYGSQLFLNHDGTCSTDAVDLNIAGARLALELFFGDLEKVCAGQRLTSPPTTK